MNRPCMLNASMFCHGSPCIPIIVLGMCMLLACILGKHSLPLVTISARPHVARASRGYHDPILQDIISNVLSWSELNFGPSVIQFLMTCSNCSTREEKKVRELGFLQKPPTGFIWWKYHCRVNRYQRCDQVKLDTTLLACSYTTPPC